MEHTHILNARPPIHPGQGLLQCIGAKRLVITGLQTESCVDTTCHARKAWATREGLVEDGHSTWQADDLTAAQIIAHHSIMPGGWFVELKETRAIEFGDCCTCIQGVKFSITKASCES